MNHIIILYFLLFISASLSLSSCSFTHRKRNYTQLNGPRYVSLKNAPQSLIEPENLKIVSYNIKYSKNIDKAIALLNENNDLYQADIIFLQEMDFYGVAKIANNLHYNYVYYPAVKHPLHNRDFGNAILSKWPISEDEKIILPDPDTDKLQRIAVGATVTVGTKKIKAFCVHLKTFLNPLDRRNQINKLVRSVPKGIKHLVVAGDFNNFTKANTEAITEPFNDANFVEVSKNLGWTFKDWYILNKEKELDKIFTKGMIVVNSGKIENQNASDHLPIWAELRFEEMSL